MCDEPRLLENGKGSALGRRDKMIRVLSSRNHASLYILAKRNNSPSGLGGVVVENTCAFDSIVQSLAVAYVVSKFLLHSCCYIGLKDN